MNFLINPIHHPLFQILISFIICSGILNLGKFINYIFFKNFNFNFFNLSIGALILSYIIFFFYLVELLNIIVLPLAMFLILIGIINLNFFTDIKNLIIKLFKKDNKFFVLIAVIFSLFIIISLGPPSMSDALDYHYGVPLNIIKYYTFPNHNIWLHGSLFGFGEFLNIIPLYLKTDNFFAFFQILSLIYFFQYFYKKKINQKKIYFSILFVICTPAFLYLISGPKALLFPQLLTTMALYLYFKDNSYNRKNILIISILLIGATQFKLSFILSGILLGFLILIKTFKNDKINILNLIIILFLIFLPKIFYNLNQVSSFTFINLFTTAPIYFLEYLNNFKDNNFIFPINLFIPFTIGKFSTILGIHILLLFLLKKISIKFKKILIVTFVTIIIHFIFGQQSSRLYFEFILWISVGFYFLEKKSINYRHFNYALVPQLILTFITSLYFATIIVPTLFSLEKRDLFMKENSSDYSAIQWVNKNIPNNAAVISQLRSVSFFNNKAIPQEQLLAKNGDKLKYVNFLKLHEPLYYITNSDTQDNLFFVNCLGKLYKTSDNMRNATRNPYNRKFKQRVYIYHFNYKNLDFCADLNF